MTGKELEDRLLRSVATKKFLEAVGRYPDAKEIEELCLLIIELHGISLEEEIAVEKGKVTITKKK